MINDHLVGDVNFQDQETRRNYLHITCANLGSIAKTSNNQYVTQLMIHLIELLIGKGIGINSKDKNGKTALHLLIYHYKCRGLDDIVKFFIDNNANLDTTNDIQQSANYLLNVRIGSFEKINQLLQNRQTNE